jgi:MFS family permease
MTAFIIIWIGQILSLLGTAISQFGLRLWTFEKSGGLATPMTWIGFAFIVPMILFTPIVGILVDRSNRRLMMMFSDLAAAFTTLVIMLLFITGNLRIWHLYVTAFISGTFQGFQWPAYSAAISLMLEKKHYTRANAMLGMAGPASNIFAPVLAGAMIGPLGHWITENFPRIAGQVSGQPGLIVIFILDLISAVFAIGTLLFVHIPQPDSAVEDSQERVSFWKQAIFGFDYIFKRPSLLGLQLVFLVGNFFYVMGIAIRDPMILARTNSNEIIFGSVQTAAAIGGVIGGLVIGAWGGFRRRIHGVLFGWTLSGVALVTLGLPDSRVMWLIGSFMAMFISPLINASNQSIWQAKVPPEIQGRVFATRRLIAWLVSPVAQLLAGPLADQIFEPLTKEDTFLSAYLPAWLGSGSGTGMALQIGLAGLLTVFAGVGGYLFPMIRDVESGTPDHDECPIPTPPPEDG